MKKIIFLFSLTFAVFLLAACSSSQGNASTIPKDCTSWFDGCNNCFVENGEIGGCTRKYCPDDMMEEPKCLKFGD